MKARLTDHSPSHSGPETKKVVTVKMIQRSGPNSCFVELLEDAVGYPKGQMVRINNSEIVKE